MIPVFGAGKTGVGCVSSAIRWVRLGVERWVEVVEKVW